MSYEQQQHVVAGRRCASSKLLQNAVERNRPIDSTMSDQMKIEQTLCSPKMSKKQKSTTSNKDNDCTSKDDKLSKSRQKSLKERFFRTKSKAENSRKTRDAAVRMQSVARGWLQRMRYRLLWLQHRLDYVIPAQRDASLALIQSDLEAKKRKIKAKVSTKAERLSHKLNENRRVLALLRTENTELRKERDELKRGIHQLGIENAKLLKLMQQTSKTFRIVNDQAKKYQDVQAHVQQLIPQYVSSIQQVKSALAAHKSSATAEHRLKLLFMTAMGRMTEMIEKRCQDDRLVESIVVSCLSTDSFANTRNPSVTAYINDNNESTWRNRKLRKCVCLSQQRDVQ